MVEYLDRFIRHFHHQHKMIGSQSDVPIIRYLRQTPIPSSR